MNTLKLPKSYLTVSALDLGLNIYPDALPIVLTDILNPCLASAAKAYLLRFFDGDCAADFFLNKQKSQILLKDLDSQPQYNSSCFIFICNKSGFDKTIYSFGDLIRLTARLTAPDGCPWDKEQTHNTIRLNLIEEAYEAVDAIDSGNKNAIIEELGDVLLQSVLHADIAKRGNNFTIQDIINTLCRKLYLRHPHVFGQKKASDTASALKMWEGEKAKEKNYDSINSQLNALPDGFASALKAQKIFKKLQKEYTEPSEKERLNDALFKEILFLLNSFSQNISSNEIGEFLFLAVAICTIFGFDSEVELNKFCNSLIKNCKQKDILFKLKNIK